MRLFGRQLKSSELFIFIFAYLVANYVFMKCKQKWQEPQTTNPEVASGYEDKRLDADFLGGPPDVGPLAEPEKKLGLASVDELVIATEQPPGVLEGMYGEEDGSDEPDEPGDSSSNANQPKPSADEEGIPETSFDYHEFDAAEHDQQKLKIILFWNTFFTATDFRFGLGHQAFLDHKCPVHSCRTTTDRKQLLQADAIVFHGPRIEGFPPPERRPGQIYIYVQQEPHYIMSQEELPAFKNQFNLTMTHRADSDIHIPYGRVVYNEDAVRPKPVHVNPQSRKNTVVWAASHCSTPSRREWYVKELQKYIDIDIYGSCGDLQCSKDDYLFCYSKFEKEYRFYMALENNYCTDYISEKVYRPLLYKIVPIVFGGGNYSHGTPPHSVINVADFQHPKDLAKYLNYLSENEKAYNKYFAWKNRGFELEHQRKVIMGDGFCKLCEILHSPNYKYKDYRDLKSWWVNGMCDSFTIPRWRKKMKW